MGEGNGVTDSYREVQKAVTLDVRLSVSGRERIV